ncbi:MAG TPA: hypothetical protein V6C86_12265 [Oculatellaceae cyanobacterium]
MLEKGDSLKLLRLAWFLSVGATAFSAAYAAPDFSDDSHFTERETAPPARVHLSDQARRSAQPSPNDDWDADRKALMKMPVPRMVPSSPEDGQTGQGQDVRQYSPSAPYQLQDFDTAGNDSTKTLGPDGDSNAESNRRTEQNVRAGRPRTQADEVPLQRKPLALQGGVSTKVNNFGSAQDLRDVGAQDAHMFNLYAGSPPPYPDPKMVSPTLYHNWLKETHSELGVTDKSAIVEIKGQWDDSGHILHYFGLPYTRIGTNTVAKYDFSHASVAIVDCAGNLNQESVDTLRSFVFDGGYLVTTDWALDNFLVRAFPGAIEWNGGYSYPDLVDAIIVEPNPDLIKNCVPHARWKLDDKCQTVKVRRPEYVHVLVRSPMLCRQDPDGRGILACTFQYGKGQVLHVVGHFDINSTGTFVNSLPDPAPRIGIGLRQAIIANFVVAGLNAHAPGKPKTASTDSSTDPGDSSNAPAR